MCLEHQGNLPHGIFAAGGAFVPTQEKKGNFFQIYIAVVKLL